MKRVKIILSILVLCYAFLFSGDKFAYSKEKISLDDVYQAYRNALEDTYNRAKTFGLKDINKDGIPELLINNAYQICTYNKDKGIIWLWDSWVICEMYYSEKSGRILYHYSYQDDYDWTVFDIDSVELIWVDSFGLFQGKYYHGYEEVSPNELTYKEVTKEEVDSALEKIIEMMDDKELLTTPYENTQENRDRYLPVIKLDKEKLTVYAGGDKGKLSVTGTDSSVKWSSSDSSIAKVTKNGYVYGLRPGKCKIKAVVEGQTLECTVTVKEISLNKTSLTLNVKETYQLKVNGIKDGIKWSSSDKSVVKVSDKGKITALKKGTATVKATVNNVTYTCKVKVK